MLELFILPRLIETAGDEKGRHKSFLRSEFEANEFLRTDAFGINDAILSELVGTIFEPSFEGRRSTHGAIICSHSFDQFHPNIPFSTWVPEPSDQADIYCDGIKTFRVICPGANGTVSYQGLVSFSLQFVLDELDLFTIRDDAIFVRGKEDHESELRKDLALIKKSPLGEITVLCRDGIAVHRDARISFFNYQYHFKVKIRKYLTQKYDSIPWGNQTIDSILRIAIHTLGAEAGVGGTIVLLHPDDDVTSGTAINQRNAIVPPSGMSITNRDHQHLLGSLMRNTDGAVIVSHDGHVASARNWFVIPADVMSGVGSDGGTRHLTAKLFSSLIKGMVFVISSDGPVTVYCSGEKVFRTCERR